MLLNAPMQIYSMARKRSKAKSRTRAKPRTARAKEKPLEPESRSFEKGMEDFGEEVGKIGDRFGRRMERRHREWHRDWESAWNRTFGVTGPFFSSVFGLICLAVVLWIFSFINIPLGSVFLNSVYSFVLSNMPLFFAFFLFFSYTSYASKRFRRSYTSISPVMTAIGITIGFWIIMSALFLINVSFANVYLDSIATFIQYNLLGIFAFFLVIGYIVLFARAITGHLEKPELFEHSEGSIVAKEKPAAREIEGVKRLYRSGRDKILGGVCGGIAEYLGVDPVLIRLIWVIITLAWGVGILAYIIAWIIIPRNPADRWS